MSKRKRFSPEYKREIVELVRRSKSSCRQVALEVGINPNMLTRWVREADSGGSKAFPGGGTPRDEEVARLKRELSRVTKERDFLRDAALSSTRRRNGFAQLIGWRSVTQGLSRPFVEPSSDPVQVRLRVA